MQSWDFGLSIKYCTSFKPYFNWLKFLSQLPKKRPERFVPSYGVRRPIRKLKVSEARKRPLTSQGSCDQIFENIHQEFSTLSYLMGGKVFPDPELVFKAFEKTVEGM